MTTIYLLDALFVLLGGMAALFAFGVLTSRYAHTFKMMFYLFMALFLVALFVGYLSPAREIG